MHGCKSAQVRESVSDSSFDHVQSSGAGVAELADAWDLKSQARKGVRVRFPPPAPIMMELLTVRP